MENISSIHISLINDRGQMKWRVNLIKGNKIFGFLKPVNTQLSE
jgi:hypothetical protein